MKFPACENRKIKKREEKRQKSKKQEKEKNWNCDS